MQVQVLFSAPNKKGLTVKRISFGTSGHRGIMGDSFTMDHVVAIALAVADYLKETNPSPKIILGYDPRRGNSPLLEAGSFTQAVADVFIRNKADVYFFDSFTPTPVVSWFIEKLGIDGGLILTASHNPPNYNGLKFNPANGAPAPPEVTKIIEDKANAYLKNLPSLKQSPIEGKVKTCHDFDEFAADLVGKINNLTKLKAPNFGPFSIAVDCRHGATAEVWKSIFAQMQLTHTTILNETPLADFGDVDPNPTNPETLTSLAKTVIEKKASFGIANDPDGDRHMVIDEKGQIITPEELSILFFNYLNDLEIPMWGICSTVASSQLLKKAMAFLGLNFEETKVGFKYFAPYLETARKEKKIAFGVESSGGFTASFHTLEKCGFLPAVLLLYLLKEKEKPLSELVGEMTEKYGRYFFSESELTLLETDKINLISRLESEDESSLQPFFNQSIKEVNKCDGLKIVFEEDDWVLIRPSGTEPVIRIYGESTRKEQSLHIISETTQMITSQTR